MLLPVSTGYSNRSSMNNDYKKNNLTQKLTHQFRASHSKLSTINSKSNVDLRLNINPSNFNSKSNIYIVPSDIDEDEWAEIAKY